MRGGICRNVRPRISLRSSGLRLLNLGSIAIDYNKAQPVMRVSTGHTTIICLSRNAALALAVTKRRARADENSGATFRMRTVFAADVSDMPMRVVARPKARR
jgi:hypothetical protein